MSGTDPPVELELRFFATFREAVGQKEITREFDGDGAGDDGDDDGVDVGSVLVALESEYPELAGELLGEDGDIRPQLSVLKNGREVVHLEGTETRLEAGDRLSVFPPVAGG